jgi:flagellar biosynthesis/type III secretory pathway chaperone
MKLESVHFLGLSTLGKAEEFFIEILLIQSDKLRRIAKIKLMKTLNLNGQEIVKISEIEPSKAPYRFCNDSSEELVMGLPWS